MHDSLKNVTSIFNEHQTREARYEYTPFGKLLTAEGNIAHSNKFCFSCEYVDHELGLIYYNYRYLNPADGRWINRDPIQEQSKWNLYGIAGNNHIHNFDFLGLKVIEWELGDVKEIVKNRYDFHFRDPEKEYIEDTQILVQFNTSIYQLRNIFVAAVGGPSLLNSNPDVLKIYVHYMAGRGTDYTFDPKKLPRKPEMTAIRQAILFVKQDPKNRCNKNIRMKNWGSSHAEENGLAYVLGDYRYIVGGIVDDNFKMKYSLYIHDIYDFNFLPLNKNSTWREKLGKCFRNTACFLGGIIPEYVFNAKTFIVKGVKEAEYDSLSDQ